MVTRRTTAVFFSASAAALTLGLVALAVSAQDPPVLARVVRGSASLHPRIVIEPLPDGRTYRMHTFRVSLAHARLAVIDLRMSRAFDDVLRERGASLVINGGFFGLQGEPEGLVKSGGRLVSPFRSSLGGGIVATKDGVARLLDAQGALSSDDADFAMQCRPRLVVDRNVNIRRDDGNRADRTALCLRDGGRTMDVVVARTNDEGGRDGPTLYRFARALLRSGCEQALNLDGGPSTGAAWRDGSHVRFLPPRAPVRHAVAIWLNDAR